MSNLHTNWTVIQDEFDSQTQKREFKGKMTPMRWEAIKQYVKRFNRENKPDRRCGHDWDCCGCVTRNYMEISFEPQTVVIYWSVGFNC